jgi:ribosome-binding protein aMBF1 (putative translation factor)
MEEDVMKKNPFIGNESASEYVRRRSARDAEFAVAATEEFDRLGMAQKIRSLRVKRGLSQEQLATRARTKQPHIARLEAGRTTPRLDVLHRIAGALGFAVNVRFVPHRGR